MPLMHNLIKITLPSHPFKSGAFFSGYSAPFPLSIVGNNQSITCAARDIATYFDIVVRSKFMVSFYA
jgi:hypothetical protein